MSWETFWLRYLNFSSYLYWWWPSWWFITIITTSLGGSSRLAPRLLGTFLANMVHHLQARHMLAVNVCFTNGFSRQDTSSLYKWSWFKCYTTNCAATGVVNIGGPAWCIIMLLELLSNCLPRSEMPFGFWKVCTWVSLMASTNTILVHVHASQGALHPEHIDPRSYTVTNRLTLT